MTADSWKEALSDRMPAELAREIDVFETQIELKKLGKVEDKLFAETRLRRGAYGQRYDNGQRHDGVASQRLDYPCGDSTKGPGTVWDAPGMQRIKIPLGRLSAEQMDLLAELAEEYSNDILHLTTRQDIQLHFVHLEDTPDLMRRLASVGITTREACGNTVRNVTACPYTGVCPDESFDITPFAHGCAYFFLGHRDAQEFGRKFKIAFSGCKQHACGLANMHDIGAIAVTREENGNQRRGFELHVGGGLGAVPHQAKLYDAFVEPDELLPTMQAIARVFARLGEKTNRARARLKFLVAKLGLDEFRRLVSEERGKLPPDERWTTRLEGGDVTFDKPRHAGAPLPPGDHGAGFEAWRATNVRPQTQAGYAAVTVRCPLGDLSSNQMRRLADMARRFCGDTVRATVEQNLVFRWVREADLPAFHAELGGVGLDQAGAGTIADITACPGTDTCKLGISSSRGLADELERGLRRRLDILEPDVRGLRVKVSGCYNSCGQQQIADIGFTGVSRIVGNRRVPHFQLVLGGQWVNNAGAFGMAVCAFPSQRIPEVLDRITRAWIAERSNGESFRAWVARVGKACVRSKLEDLIPTPSYEEDPTFYSDWGDPREYSIGDLGVGECAGEVISGVQFGLAEAEREVFEAQLQLDGGKVERATATSLVAMLEAAKALVRERVDDVDDGADEIVDAFQRHFVDTRLFFDLYAGGKFANYLLAAHRQRGETGGADLARQRIEEAQLFIEAAHACYDRMTTEAAAGVSG